MPIPSNFNTWEHLQALLMSLQNRMVTEEFRDVEDLDNITTPRSSLKSACWLRDADTAVIALVKMFLFHVIIKNEELLPIYAMPVAKFKSEAISYKPQCLLKFKSPYSDDEPEHEQGILEAEISFRLMWGDSVTKAKVKHLASQIHSTFGSSVFKWKKGTEIFSYRDLERGYELRLYVYSEEEGERVVRKILAIQDHPYEEKFKNFSKSGASFPVNPGTKTILEKTVKRIRRRPIGSVIFQSAQFDWAELNEPIWLVKTLTRNGLPTLIYR